VTKHSAWAADAGALQLLDTLGGPFATSSFRAAVVATVSGWEDVSFGARAEDGTLAALPLLARERQGDSVPPAGYGGVIASRPLETAELESFLDLASSRRLLSRIVVRVLELPGIPAAGDVLATASVVPVAVDEPPASRYGRLARRSLARATAAGATVSAASSHDAFWPLYARVTSSRGALYPEPLVVRLVDDATARVHAVRLGDRIVATLLTIVRGAHWMCWLAAQSEEGRAVAASYLAYDAVLGEARAAGIPFVNLGASVGGGAEFKHHLGAVEVGMRVWTRENFRATARAKARRIFSAGAALVRRGNGRA
jgi:hypothetical protein